MALTEEEMGNIDQDLKEIIGLVDTLTKDDLKTKLVSLRAKLKREEKDEEKSG